METKTRKTTMIGAALAVAIIALAGVGYAVTYHATTTNEKNFMDSTYVTMTQTSSETAAYSGNFLAGLYFDSENTVDPDDVTKNVTVYRPVYTGVYNETAKTYAAHSSTQQGSDNAALISKNLSLVIVPSATKEDQTGKLVVTAYNSDNSAVNLNGDLKFIMLLSGTGYTEAATYNDGTTEGSTKGWTFSSVPISASSQTYTVQLIVQLNGDSAETNATGFATSANYENGSGFSSIFKFELTTDA